MTMLDNMRDLLGGEIVTGPLRTEGDVVDLVRRGLPTGAVDHFLRASDLSFNAIETQVLARRTFRRRQEAGELLDPGESDRLVRLVRLVAAAEETFGERSKALVWLNRPSRALGGQSPLSLTDTDQGARMVEALLGRIGHGLAA